MHETLVALRRGWAVHVLLVVGAVSFIVPFYWMLSTSLKGPKDLYASPPVWWPRHPEPEFITQRQLDPPDRATAGEYFEELTQNYPAAWNAVPFPRYFFNTIFVATCIVIGVVVTSGLSAFAFSFLRFRGRVLRLRRHRVGSGLQPHLRRTRRVRDLLPAPSADDRHRHRHRVVAGARCRPGHRGRARHVGAATPVVSGTDE